MRDTTDTPTTQAPTEHEPRAKYITHANALAIIGPWAMVQRLADELGVRKLRIGRRLYVPADELFEAMERVAVVRAANAPPPREPTPDEREAAELERMRAQLRAVGEKR